MRPRISTQAGLRLHEFAVQHRQGGDAVFRRLLQELRVGLVSEAAMVELRRHQPVARPAAPDAASRLPSSLQIYPTRAEVRAENALRMAALPRAACGGPLA